MKNPHSWLALKIFSEISSNWEEKCFKEIIGKSILQEMMRRVLDDVETRAA